MTVMFVSDIHLCSQRQDLTDAFIHFLDTTASECDKLYLLGDIFEAWIGDDYDDPDMQPVVVALKKLSSKGCKLFFQHGNRDFLVGKAFANAIDATLLGESEIIELATTKALIMHGDQLCVDDVEYQNFRSMVRSDAWQQSFLDKTIAQRVQIAKQLRSASKEQTKRKDNQITDVNSDAVVAAIDAAEVNLLIHGHTHRPARHQLTSTKQPSERIVLGDWDKSLWYLKCDRQGCELIEQKL